MVFSDQRKEVRVHEVLPSLGLPFTKINFCRRSHRDCSDTLTIIESSAMDRKAKAALIPSPHSRHCGVISPIDGAINMGGELSPHLPRQLFEVLPRDVETGAAILKHFVDLRQNGNLIAHNVSRRCGISHYVASAIPSDGRL